ncbi:hypothetical protein VNI00_000722 [Paramarasmius palmivorus]|uniref:Ketoreductase (KR) domain-containing protein n=1 Tax=Paramarasmius palmivorus TaxID=297713 RepID=A0AAW0E9T5_9AGAR
MMVPTSSLILKMVLLYSRSLLKDSPIGIHFVTSRPLSFSSLSRPALRACRIRSSVLWSIGEEATQRRSEKVMVFKYTFFVWQLTFFDNGRLAREKKIINYLHEEPGIRIDLVGVDCLDNVKTLFSNLPNITGVFYGAIPFNDSISHSYNQSVGMCYLDVKVKGFRAVHPKTLDFLVLMSSMATVSGSPGQVNYAAAQTEMEAMGANIPNCISVTVPPLTDCRVFVRSMPTGNARNAALDKYKDLCMAGMKFALYCIDAIRTIGTPAYITTTNWRITKSTSFDVFFHCSSLSERAQLVTPSKCVVVLVQAAQKVHYPVYGVQDTPEAPITGISPSPLYRLGGFSFGACLASDTADSTLFKRQ